MALLGDRKGGRYRTLATLGVLGLMAGASCVVWDVFGAEKPLAFSHRMHVEGEGLQCLNCHEDFAVSDDPGMPAEGQCQLCHLDLDEGKQTERRVESLFEQGRFRAVAASALDAEAVFSHRLHVGSVEECGACHRDIEASERITARSGLDMDDCMDCHANSRVPNDCATCHRVIRPEWEPDSHDRSWKRLHGKVVRALDGGTMNRCSLCHLESSCDQCHLQEPPASHNEHWRLRGHALVARMDRENCAACHQSPTCDSCHSEVAPLSHSGSWGSPSSTHCLACHFPLRATGCIVCHGGTPSHALATPMPPWHTPAMNCRQCHGVSLRLPHVDNGDNCLHCHA